MSRRQIDVMMSFPVFDVISSFNVKKCGKSVFNTLTEPFRRNINNKKVNLQSFV